MRAGAKINVCRSVVASLGWLQFTVLNGLTTRSGAEAFAGRADMSGERRA